MAKLLITFALVVALATAGTKHKYENPK